MNLSIHNQIHKLKCCRAFCVICLLYHI